MFIIFLYLLTLKSHATLSSTCSLHTRNSYMNMSMTQKGEGLLASLFPVLSLLPRCVISALHLNVPMKSGTRTQRYLRYIKWILLGQFLYLS